MEKIKGNVVASFRLAKRDIISLQRQVNEVSAAQERMMEFMAKYSVYKQRKIAAAKHIMYVASDLSNKFHIESCPFAHNIKQANKRKFGTRKSALSHGFKPCECVL